MKRLFVVLLCIASLCWLSSCDNISQEPQPDKEELTFTAEGGTEVITIKKHNGDAYKGRATWFYEVPHKNSGQKKLSLEALEDGSLRYYNDWLSFIVDTSYTQIKVVAKKNETAKARRCIFDAGGGKLGFRITVLQKAK